MIYPAIIQRPDDLDEFRTIARQLLAAGAAPADVAWSNGPTQSLFQQALPQGERVAAVPRSFITLASAVICHRDDQRWSLLYQALWRLDRGESALMHQVADPLMHRLARMADAVKHDQHRMTAFLRFRMVRESDDELYIAWYQPRHRILRRTSAFFIDRFTNMRFSILTPDLTLHWDRHSERFAPGLRREDASSKDAVEDWWRRYYAAIFNPARSNARLLQRHMPKQFWRDLPEASLITQLIAEAGGRTDQMIRNSADQSLP
ncbi:TIGR03915 family putative DNA repair protein [Rhodopila sp.]|uniref:TIGR03915 family putative DNA repair protein n=1 Tax=Rhodopila sp. TaxID=2480087 RepID=UPI003D1043DC